LKYGFVIYCFKCYGVVECLWTSFTWIIFHKNQFEIIFMLFSSLYVDPFINYLTI
jgi:hypothetical protein